MVEVKKAEALANRKARVISQQTADAVIAGCDLILKDERCLDQFPVDMIQGGAGTSLTMNTNEVVANLALETMGLEKGRYDVINPNDDVNKSQSTNDAYLTGMRLAMYRSTGEVQDALTALVESFDVLAERNMHVLKMGRTQLQDAVPMAVGEEFSAFAELLREEVKLLGHAKEQLLEMNLGGTAIGTGVNTPPGFQDLVVDCLSEVTGLPCTPDRDLIKATSDTSTYVALHGALKRTAIKLSKVCNDLRLLSSGPRAGLNEIDLPEMAAGSSIMPAKVNPVIPEVVNQVCFKVIGNDTTVSFGAEAGQLQLSVMEPIIAQSIFESMDLMVNALQVSRERCVDGITVNEELCKQSVMNSIGIVTYLNDIIGHHNGDLVGKECARTGKSVKQLVLEMGLMDEDALEEALSAENLPNPTCQGECFD